MDDTADIVYKVAIPNPDAVAFIPCRGSDGAIVFKTAIKDSNAGTVTVRIISRDSARELPMGVDGAPVYKIAFNKKTAPVFIDRAILFSCPGVDRAFVFVVLVIFRVCGGISSNVIGGCCAIGLV